MGDPPRVVKGWGKFYARRGGPTGSVLVQEFPWREDLCLRGAVWSYPERRGARQLQQANVSFRYSKVDLEVWNFVALWPFGEGEV